MSRFQEFDLLQARLHGKNLIEASAGTGKTFAISRVFLRLLLERRLKVQQILVVTFTEAATNELKDRVQRVLLDTRAALDGGPVNDPFIARYMDGLSDRGEAAHLLNTAIQDFDEAAIFTIHKFCNRVLQEQAFESGGLFDTELVTEQTQLLRQIVEDFWRQRITTESGLFLRYALATLSIKSLFSLVEGKAAILDKKIIPDVTPEDCQAVEQMFALSYARVRQAWPGARQAVNGLLLDGRLSGNSYRQTTIPGLISSMDDYTMTCDPNPALFDKFDKFTTDGIQGGTKNAHKGNPPAHPFFDICQEHFANFQRLNGPYERRVLWLKKGLFDFTHAELKRRKQAQNIFYFDDLLLNVHAALQSESQGLAESVRARYRAALIDEFQDTDPLQYEIFRKIFDRPGGTLFLIGDPKQAIYGFRGADIFAYMKAKEETPDAARFTLTTNYRSVPRLIAACNALFEQQNTFLYDEIPFQRATPAAQHDPGKLELDGVDPAPFQLWFTDPAEVSGERRKLSSDESKEFIIQAVVTEIVKLLNAGREGRATLDGERLEEKHIAVLVRANADAQRVQQVLKGKGVNSVLYSTESLFASREATELQRVLAAIAQPRRSRVVKAALATEMIGVPGEKLLEAREDDSDIAPYFTRFTRYHLIWQGEGFIRMFRAVLSHEDVVARLMAFSDGERRVTNLLHLAEVLNSASLRRKLGMAGLLAWLQEQREFIDRSVEAHQIRLESDENAVKLLTMHMSKGLQYPIVFCPFTWGASTMWGSEPYDFHDQADNFRHTLDLALSDANRAAAEREKLAENLRLLYVAVTRAQNRCYLIWGPLPGYKSSAPAYLLHPPPAFDPESVVTRLQDHVRRLKGSALRERVAQLARASGDSISVKDLGKRDSDSGALTLASEVPRQLVCRSFSAKVDTAERISSYSALVSRQPHASELADHDPFALTRMAGDPGEDVAADFSDFRKFPKGAKTGSFIHHVFQHVSFAPAQDVQREEVVVRSLQEFGYEPAWKDAVLRLITSVLRQPLKLAGESVRFLDVPDASRLNEMEFYFPVSDVSPKRLYRCFEQTPVSSYRDSLLERVAALQFRQFHGFMKGFVDLILEHRGKYYIVDWKSNFLGADPDKYQPAALADTMVNNLYILQYHIYTLALDSYLAQRLTGYEFEKHFGGVFYIFLRGIVTGGGSQAGIFADRPASEVIEHLKKEITATGH